MDEAFTPAEAEMRVDDMHVPKVCFDRHFNGRAAFLAEKWWRSWQLDCATKGKGISTKYRVAIVLIVPAHGGMKVAIPPKVPGDDFSLIRSGGTASPEIKFLECDDIR